MSGKPKISIFIPVYNGSYYLCKTVDSVLNQTFGDFELVCVDDSSTDRSLEILREYAITDSRIRIFQKPNGGSVPKVWNYVMPYLRGENIMYMSQDDLISKDTLDKLNKRKNETGADCVLPDMVYYYESEEDNRKLVGVNGNRDIILTNKEAVILSLKWEIHGFALWNSSIILSEVFPEDSFDSDEFMTRKFFLKSNKIAFCDGIFYYRQDNVKAITKTSTIKNYYSLLTKIHVYNLLKDNDFEHSTVRMFLLEVQGLYTLLFRLCALRSAINSTSEYKTVVTMLNNLYSDINKLKNVKIHELRTNFKLFKFILLKAFNRSFLTFRVIMFFTFLVDKSKSNVELFFGKLHKISISTSKNH